MALIHINIFGKPIDDVLLFKLIVGTVCIVILLIAMGTTSFGDWVQDSLSIYIASILFIIPFTYVFVEEEFKLRHFAMMAIGSIILVIYAITAHVDALIIFVNIIKSLTFATIISIILEPFVKHLKR
ncbi:MAG: hypothetical protein IMZ64_06695 [Bacteroidetes bacterium]|nr:hypothetical protein [Bacteroidota bacterium]